MNVLFINTADESGGAAVVTKRLMKGLNDYHQTKNSLLVRFKQSDQPNIEATVSSFFPKAFERTIESLSRLTGLQYLYFPFSSAKIVSHTRKFKPDIISLHNAHGGYFPITLLKKLSSLAPIVWTLHDMWSFTGNSAHTFGNMSWKQMKNDRHLTRIEPEIGINTGEYLLKLKKRVYASSNISIVTPSVWLRKLAVQSPVFDGKKIFHIYNGVDDTVFRKKDKALCRTALGLPASEKIIAFGAQKITTQNPWKGGRDLIEILKRINDSTRQTVNLLIIGEGEMKELEVFDKCRVFKQGYIRDENRLCDCLNAADLIIYPSRADNLPNILVESISSGTPCVAFNIGGINEIINENNGVLVEPSDFDEFAKQTLELLNNPARLSLFAANALMDSHDKFRLELMANSYFKLFDSILEAQENRQV